MENKPHIGVGAVVIDNDKILLARRQGAHGAGMYGSFGGHLEFGETPIEALRREAREELGIVIKVDRLLSCLNIIKFDKHYLDLTFLAHIINGTPTIKEPDKIASVDWYPLDKLPHPIFPPQLVSLQALRTGQVYWDKLPEC